MDSDKAKRVFWICLDLWAALMIFSVVLYAFAGLHFWAPLSRDENGVYPMGREMALTMLHFLPVVLAGFRRIA